MQSTKLKLLLAFVAGLFFGVAGPVAFIKFTEGDPGLRGDVWQIKFANADKDYCQDVPDAYFRIEMPIVELTNRDGAYKGPNGVKGPVHVGDHIGADFWFGDRLVSIEGTEAKIRTGNWVSGKCSGTWTGEKLGR